MNQSLEIPKLRTLALCAAAACACCASLSAYFGGAWGSLAALFGCALLFIGAMMLRPSAKEGLSCALMGGVFGVMYTVSHSSDTVSSYALIMKNARTLICGALCMLALSLVAACACLLLIRLLDRMRCAAGTGEEPGACEQRRLFIFCAALIFLGSVPYLLLYAPGLNIYDTRDQLLQFFGYPSYIGDGSALSDHHPVFLTVVYGAFIKLGLLLGDANIGQLIYSLLSMLALSLCWACALCALCREGLSRRVCKGIAVFAALYPVMALYAFNMCKDVSAAPFVLLLTAQMIRLHRTDGEIIRNRRFAAGLFAVLMLLMLTRKPSMYALAFAAVFLIIRFRGVRVRFAGVLLGAVALFQFGCNGVLLPALGVIPGEAREMLSIPFQQTARYLITYPEDVTQEEMGAVSAVLNVEYSVTNYMPHLSDPVKDSSNPDLSGGKLINYARAWLSMGLRHPGVYLDAWLNMICGYFYPSQSNTVVCLTLNSPDQGGVNLVQDERLDEERLALHDFIYFTLRRLPGVGLLFYASTFTWAFLFLLAYMVLRGGLREAAPWMFFVGTLGICMLSPKSGEIRYLMPVVYALPLMLGAALLPMRSKRSAPSADSGAESVEDS